MLIIEGIVQAAPTAESSDLHFIFYFFVMSSGTP